MFFNSINFALFFSLVFLLYWLMLKKSVKLQNLLLLASSYFFYACWDWRFLFLLLFSTFVGYICGLKISTSTTQRGKKRWLILSLLVSISTLCFFKYYNFFVYSFQDLLSLFGMHSHLSTLQIILPVGISFYTFHGLSYVLDIYNGKRILTSSWINYSLFVGFFPLLIAGPIERATHLLPQIESSRTFNYAKITDGLRQILWGLFKKMVVADGCAEYANILFNDGDGQPGSAFLLGAIFFSFQIYGDFSGYSDLAIGISRMLGIELLQNFKYPYFARNIGEFWRRWHISLSSWFRDYLYIPLGGSRQGISKTLRNIFIVFLICGLWHGADWTFVIWGALHGLYVCVSVLMKRLQSKRLYIERDKGISWLLPIKKVIGVFITFLMVTFAWIFFRADNMTHAIEYINAVPLHIFAIPPISKEHLLSLSMVVFMLVVEWQGRRGKYALENFSKIKSGYLRWGFYYLLLILIFLFTGDSAQFIYFQF